MGHPGSREGKFRQGQKGRLTDECACDDVIVNADRDVGQGPKRKVTLLHM